MLADMCSYKPSELNNLGNLKDAKLIELRYLVEQEPTLTELQVTCTTEYNMRAVSILNRGIDLLLQTYPSLSVVETPMDIGAIVKIYGKVLFSLKVNAKKHYEMGRIEFCITMDIPNEEGHTCYTFFTMGDFQNKMENIMGQVAKPLKKSPKIKDIWNGN